MDKIYIYVAIGFAAGVVISAFIAAISIARLKKVRRSLEGFLESERLRKETVLKENNFLYESQSNLQEEYQLEIQKLKALNKRLDEDVLLLQKSNEETESLMEAGMPVVHSLKLQLIEANNTIARYKAQFDRITTNKELSSKI